MSMTITERVEEFKTQGYTLFEGVYDDTLMRQWREKHTELQQEEIRGDLASHPTWWFKDMVEHAPKLMLPAVANPLILDFAEAVMGPFVQLDNLTLAGFPSVSPDDAKGKVSGWHRDRWAQVPRGVYERPNAINAICYLQDLTPEYGPLRAIPGSHVRPITLSAAERGLPHPEEVIVPMKAGDVIVIHNCLLHSGTPNTSGQTRFFFSIFYNLTWLHHTIIISARTCSRYSAVPEIKTTTARFASSAKTIISKPAPTPASKNRTRSAGQRGSRRIRKR